MRKGSKHKPETIERLREIAYKRIKEGFYINSPENLEKRRQTLKKKKEQGWIKSQPKGYKLSEEAKEKYRKVAAIRNKSPEYIQKISSTKLGSKNPQSKLTEDKVKEIVELYSQGTPKKVIASRYNVSRQSVNDILSGRTWAHITGIERIK